SDLDGDLSVQIVDGALQPAVFRALGNPGVTCIVDGGAWDGTIWGIIVTENGVTYNRYMMLLSHGFDEHNVPIYRWGFFDEGDDIWSKAAYKPTCVEDKDPYANAFVYRYHAYLVEDLHVAADGTFSEAPSTFFLACRSGAVGKAIHWGYNPAKWGMELHELATRVVRADYCGTGVSFTQAGNAVQLHDKLTPQVNEFSKVTLTDEAAWDLDLSRATCVTLPRDHALRNGFQGIDCGGPDLVPFCTGDDMDDATIATKVAD
ncbi:MAG: ADYC domain-containing protein, partial [Nannocystaceae bacterium]